MNNESNDVKGRLSHSWNMVRMMNILSNMTDAEFDQKLLNIKNTRSCGAKINNLKKIGNI